MESSPERDNSLVALLTTLETAASVPAKQRTVKLSDLVTRFCSKAYEEGLPNASLEKLVDIITLPNELDQASVGNLIRNLYPAGKVPDKVVVKVVGSLGHGKTKPSYSSQAALLKWLVMVFDVIENHAVLSRLYDIFFNLLDTVAIRTPLCHVLSLITRRKHVRPFRIQVLMELTRQAGNDPALVGLIRVYKDYYPDVIVGDVTKGRASVFGHPNQEWRTRLGEIQEVYSQNSQDGPAAGQTAFRVTRRGMNGTKRGRTAIPEVHTFRAQETSTTLEEIEDVSDLIQKLEKIELPNQMVAVIGDPLLQKFLQLKSSNNISERIDNWLLAFFEDQLQSPDSENAVLDMLERIRDFTRYTKVLPPACLTYLLAMMDSWNGVTGRQVIFDLLAYTPIAPFEELYENIFENLEEAILADVTSNPRESLLAFYHQLLNQWLIQLLASPTINSPTTKNHIPSITALVKHASTLSLTILQESSGPLICNPVLGFYETSASLTTYQILKSSLRITIPPPELIYTLFFTSSLSTFSRLCGILPRYKAAFEIGRSQTPPYPQAYVNQFNGYLMDACNCLWRGHAFSTTDRNALGCLIPPEVAAALGKYVAAGNLGRDGNLQTLFNLSHNPLLASLAIGFVREFEDERVGKEGGEQILVRHAGPVTSVSLKQLQRDGGVELTWAVYRLGVLRYLEQRGVDGVGDLMHNTISNLIGNKKT